MPFINSALILTALISASSAQWACDGSKIYDNVTATTDNGLVFDVYPCNNNVPGYGGNLGVINQSNTFDECINTCSEHRSNNWQPCAAVLWAFREKDCWLLDSTFNSTDQLIPVITGHSAQVKELSVFERSAFSCPYTNGTNHPTTNGLGFTVYCESEVLGHDLAPGTTANGTTIPYHIHAESFDACMDYCATMRPKCYGVTYSESAYGGWWNCFPKDFGTTVGAISTFNASLNASHSALAVFPSADPECVPSGNFTTSEVDFDIMCDASVDGNFTSAVYKPDLISCVDACATDNTCVAAQYDYLADAGYENCYLLSFAQLNSSQPDWRLARRLNSTGHVVTSASDITSTASEESGSSSRSKAWIAGAVVGVLAGVAIVVAMFWWYRRSRRQASQGWGSRQKQSGMSELDTRPNGRRELDADFTERKEAPDTERKELDARQARAVATELPG